MKQLSEEYIRDLSKIPKISREKQRELLNKAKNDPEARKQAIESFVRLAVLIVSSYRMPTVEFDDMISEANVAIVDMVDNWNSEKYAKTLPSIVLKKFLHNHLAKLAYNPGYERIHVPRPIQSRIKKYNKLKEHQKNTIEDIAKELGLNKDMATSLHFATKSKFVKRMKASDDIEKENVDGDKKKCLMDIENNLTKIDKKYRIVFMMKYGLGEFNRPHKISEIQKACDISPTTVYVYVKKAIAQLKE